MKTPALVALITVAAAGCSTPGADPTAAPSGYALSLPPATAQQILDFVNYPATDLTVLDVDVGLDSRAARNIVAARDGADAVSPSADDVYFADLAQLDAVPLVGDAAFGKLARYAAAHPAPSGERVEGVTFSGWESQAVVWGVNQAENAELYALLDNRAAGVLVTNRPFTSVAQMGPLPWIGSAALGKLHAQALGWWNEKTGAARLAGRFDGVTFDEAEAEVALQIVNQATLAQLTAHGMTTTAANKIVAARPFTQLGAVAALSGVGPATMNALLTYAQSGQWGNSCVDQFAAAVAPHLPDLLFMSESDRPLDLVSFAGAGSSAPTAASIAALVGADPQSTLYTRSVGDFYNDFEPASATADPNAAAAIEAAIAAQLTDVVYVAIQPPASSVDHSLVDVYLVGRTSCGDLVGIHAISVET